MGLIRTDGETTLANEGAPIRTVDATPTVLATVNIPAGAGGTAQAHVICRDVNTGDVAYQLRVGLLRENGGNIVAVGAPTTLAQAASAALAGVAVSFDGAGGMIRVIGTGLAGKTLDWFARVSAIVLT